MHGHIGRSFFPGASMSVKSLRSLEGELTIDHRHSPGVPDALIKLAGLPLGAGRGIFETATYTCGHCQAQVVMNPERTRERGYCRRCQHVICDGCGVVMAQTLECRPFQKWADEVLTAAVAAQAKEF